MRVKTKQAGDLLEHVADKRHFQRKLQIFKQTKEVISLYDIAEQILDFQGHSSLRSICLGDVGNNHFAGDCMQKEIERHIEFFEKGHTIVFFQQGEHYTVAYVRLFKNSTKMLIKFFDLFGDHCPVSLKDSYRIIVCAV